MSITPNSVIGFLLALFLILAILYLVGVRVDVSVN